MTSLPLYGRQGKFTFRLLAVTLFGQSVILSFFALVARANAIAAGDPEEGDRLLWVGLGLALLALVASGLMRSPVGITLGWLVQALTWASAAPRHRHDRRRPRLHPALGAHARPGRQGRPDRRRA